MGMTSPFMSAFINQLVDTTNQAHTKSEAESAAEVAQQREIYNHLLKSDDPEIQSLGLTGLMEKPQKDLFGKLKKSPNYEHVRSIIQQMRGPTPDAMNLLSGGAPGVPQPPDPIRAQMDAATSAANAAPIPNTPEERAAWTAGQAPPPPGSAGMSAAAPLTGGGGQAATSGPPPNPQALLTGATTPGGAATGAPVQPPTEGHPADNVHPQGVQTYEQMLALSRMQDPLGLNPGHQKFRMLVQQMQMAGIPIEQGRRLIHDSMMPPALLQAQTMLAGIQARGEQAKGLEETKQKGRVALAGYKGDLAKDLASGKYQAAQLAEDTKYGHQRALKILGQGMADQRVTWQEMPDPSDPNGIRTIKVPITQATAKGMAASGGTLQGKLAGALSSRVTSAAAAQKRIDAINSYLPELMDHVGPFAGRVSSWEALAGMQDPVIQRFLSDRAQVGAYLTSVHAARGKAFLDAMEHAIGNLKDNPEALKAALEETRSGTQDFLDTVRPTQRSTGAPPPPPGAPAGKGGLSSEEESILGKLGAQ